MGNSKTNTKKKNNNTKKNKTIKNNSKEPMTKKQFYLTIIIVFFLAVLLIFSTYAWFSTTLNVKIKSFNMIVTKNSGLEISFDAIHFDQAIEISQDILFKDVAQYYPNHKSFWAAVGLVPVSTIGNKSRNSYFFDIYRTDGVKYKEPILKEGAYITTRFYPQTAPRKYSGFIAFDIFFKNDNNESPIPDNLYYDWGTGITFDEDISEQMQGLVNSIRIGIVKVGTLPLDANPTDIQNLKCNNNCTSVIYEPNSTSHTQMSIDTAAKYNLNVIDGQYFPTYANIDDVYLKDVKDTISGSPTLDKRKFALQETITEKDFDKPLFEIPHGITKARMYVWIEGGDIDSIETDSEGTDVVVSINFIKDTFGWEAYE